MLKIFGLLFYISFFLLQGTLNADENTEAQEIEEQIPMEEMEQKEIFIPEELSTKDANASNEPQDMQDQTAEPEVSEQDDFSEAQKEADAAEASELLEMGEGEEPLAE